MAKVAGPPILLEVVHAKRNTLKFVARKVAHPGGHDEVEWMSPTVSFEHPDEEVA